MRKNFTTTIPWKDILAILPDVIYSYADITKIADNRLVLIREIIDLHYNYGRQKDPFFKYLSALLSIDSIKKHSIVDFESGKDLLKQDFALNESENDILCLLKSGFTNRELRVIYGHGNEESINVRKSRLNKKISCILEEKMKEEKK